MASEDVQVDSGIVIQVLQDEVNSLNSRLMMQTAISKQMQKERDEVREELETFKQAVQISDEPEGPLA